MEVRTLPDKLLLDGDKIVVETSTGTGLALITDIGGGGSGAGADIRSGDKFSEYADTDDDTGSTGKIFDSLEHPEVEGDISSLEYKDLPFGLYSVIVRAQVSAISGGTVFSLEAFSGENSLRKVDILATHFSEANKWISVGVGIDYTGTVGDQLRIAVETTPSPAASYKIDYVQVSPAPVAINSIV